MPSCQESSRGPIVIEAPAKYAPEKASSVFLAGGITGCGDWQQTAIQLLQDFDGILFNPRRSHWPTELHALQEQIKWEERYLRLATLRLFWFPPETLCPITLFELGCTLGQRLPLVVGVHPLYARRDDVSIQCSLKQPDIQIATSLPKLIKQVFEHPSLHPERN